MDKGFDDKQLNGAGSARGAAGFLAPRDLVRSGRRLGLPSLALSVFLFGSTWLSAAVPGNQELLAAIPDNAWARQQLAEALVEPLAQLGKDDERVLRQVVAPQEVRFRVMREAGSVYLVFQNRVGKSWPDTAPGNVIIRRDLRGGGVDQVKLFLANDPLLFLRVTKAGSGSLLSVFFRDNQTPLYRDLPIPLPIERVALTPLATLMKITDTRVVWNLFLNRPEASFYVDSLSMVRAIRGALPYLPDADDGAMDAKGNMVKISGVTATGTPGFNCSGFAKWVADGMFRPLTARTEGQGRYLDIETLSQRQLSLRSDPASDPFEESRDPWFGLDWTRNIARELAVARLGVASGADEAQDVRKVPFLEYTEDRGYPSAELEKLLYLLAVKEPGNFYLAAVNGDFGNRPVLWQYYHIVVLFPAFDEAGRFRCAVFERNNETSLASLQKRYPKEFMHLVRIRASGDFELPRIK